MKRLIADQAEEAFIGNLEPAPLRTEKSVGIIGAGPGGIAAAILLRRNGVPVTVYEKAEGPYGIVRRVIPEFRIEQRLIDRDYRLALKQGVEFRFGEEVSSIKKLQEKHPCIVIAIGAWKPGASPVKEGPVKDALRFLEDSKKSGLTLSLGKTVAVVGGGDVAMDCARAARRNQGVEKVTIVYRRTREFMPAQREEIDLALEDGVEIRELLAPQTFTGGILRCEEMALGDYGSDGRRNITGTGKTCDLPFDTVIGAVGARVHTGFFRDNGLPVNEKGFPTLTEANESGLPGVYVAGDCKAGPATVVKAIADSRAIVRDILRALHLPADFGDSRRLSLAAACCGQEGYLLRKGVLKPPVPTAAEGRRCLACDGVCEICVDVCPNRANTVLLDEWGDRQVVHIDRLCNECGNCAAFCPQGGTPYKDKFTLFSTWEGFETSENQGILVEDARITGARIQGDRENNEWFVSLSTIVKESYLLKECYPCC
jgi:putative selenate reductase